VHPAGRAIASIVNGKAIIRLMGPQQFTVDIDGALEEHDTGSSAIHDYASNRRVVHTFTVFANPVLGVHERPSPDDPNVRTVNPGEEPPTTFSESTLYFLPGVHNITNMPDCCVTHDVSSSCPCVTDEGTRQGDSSWPGFVSRFELQGGKTYYIPSDAWLNGGMKLRGNVVGTRLSGYGHVSGHLYRWKLPYSNIGGIVTESINDTHIVGPMFVDFPNHNIIAVGGVSWIDPLCTHPACVATKNTLRHVKALGWRTNSDGVHVWGHWNEITDLFLRTNDDSMYIGGEGAPNVWRRITTWNDANGVPFIFADAPARFGDQVGQTLTDSHVLYFRKEYPYWCGGVFDLRWTFYARNVAFQNIQITDPFPTCPLFDMRPRSGNPSKLNGGNFTNLSLTNISMVAHSAYRPNDFQCSADRLRFGVPKSKGCDYPYGIPSRLIGGLSGSDKLSGLSFSNVVINGTNIGGLLNDSFAFVFSGNVDPILIDGVPHAVAPSSTAL